MNVFDYIKNYAKWHGIKDYKLITKILNKGQLSQVLTLTNNVAFFFKIFAEGEIQQVSDLTKDFLSIVTPSEIWDLSPVIEIADFSTLQKVTTDFIFAAENSVSFELSEGTSNSMFSSITNFCAQYILLIPINYEGKIKGTGKESKKEDEDSKIKIKVNY